MWRIWFQCMALCGPWVPSSTAKRVPVSQAPDVTAIEYSPWTLRPTAKATACNLCISTFFSTGVSTQSLKHTREMFPSLSHIPVLLVILLLSLKFEIFHLFLIFRKIIILLVFYLALAHDHNAVANTNLVTYNLKNTGCCLSFLISELYFLKPYLWMCVHLCTSVPRQSLHVEVDSPLLSFCPGIKLGSFDVLASAFNECSSLTL